MWFKSMIWKQISLKKEYSYDYNSESKLQKNYELSLQSIRKQIVKNYLQVTTFLLTNCW